MSAKEDPEGVLVDEQIPDELKMSDNEVLKNRCDLIESQIKQLNRMLDEKDKQILELKESNKNLILALQKVYDFMNELSDSGSDDENILDVSSNSEKETD